jgi:hypothetical protein
MSTSVIRCSKCQRAYTSLADFEQVRSLGLALKGLCRCGAWLSVGALWRKQPDAQNKRLWGEPTELLPMGSKIHITPAPVSAAQRISRNAGSKMPQKAPERL